MDIKTFLSAFYSENDRVCIRVFSDRKAEDPEYKGNKYTEKLKNIDVLLPTLKQHNEKHRGIFFVVNSGGHTDDHVIIGTSGENLVKSRVSALVPFSFLLRDKPKSFKSLKIISE